MKIKRKNLKRLIESFLNEDDTSDPKGSSSSDIYNDNSDEDDFELTDDMLDPDQSGFEAYTAATDAFEHPEKPIGNMPHFSFGDNKGVNYRTQGRHIPSSEEIDHVRRRQEKQIGGAMPSVEDIEKTIPNFGEDEDTEESPFGTQASLDNTDPQYRFDSTVPDPGHTLHSDRDFDLDTEDEEDYESSEEYSEPDTEYDVEDKKTSLLKRIQNSFKEFERKYF